MRNLVAPPRDLVREHLSVALEVRTRKGVEIGYPVTETELDAVVALYDLYDQSLGAPQDQLKGPDLAAPLRIAIRDGYDLTQRRRRLASIRTNLLRGVERCPICGISAPRTLDHHLPKEAYQPLAIYLRNLIPVCGECNQAKSASASPNPEEQFVHPYLDVLPHVRFLGARVDLSAGGLVAEFSLLPALELPLLLATRLANQLRRLHLNDRYAQEINTYLSSQSAALHWIYDAGGAQFVVEHLRRQSRSDALNFHMNDWRAVLMLALSEHADFCDGGFRNVLPAPPPGAP